MLRPVSSLPAGLAHSGSLLLALVAPAFAQDASCLRPALEELASSIDGLLVSEIIYHRNFGTSAWPGPTEPAEVDDLRDRFQDGDVMRAHDATLFRLEELARAHTVGDQARLTNHEDAYVRSLVVVTLYLTGDPAALPIMAGAFEYAAPTLPDRPHLSVALLESGPSGPRFGSTPQTVGGLAQRLVRAWTSPLERGAP